MFKFFPKRPRRWLAKLAYAWVLVLLVAPGVRAEPDPRCQMLFVKAAQKLAAEQYVQALRLAKDRWLLCKDLRSVYILGLSQANMVDKLIVSDPAAREQMRLSALKNLRAAVAGDGAGLRPEWMLSVHEWIVALTELGDGRPSDDDGYDVLPDAEGLQALQPLGYEDEPRTEHVGRPAIPPAPQPSFPLGPLVLGLAGGGALVAGLVTGVEAGDAQEEADATARELRSSLDQLDEEELQRWVGEIQDTTDEADSLRTWSTALLIGGGAAVTTGVLWYVLLPPEGKWRWAVTPTGARVTVNF